MSNGETAQEMVHQQAKRVRDVIEASDYSKCPVGGSAQKDVQLFLVDGMTAILEQSRSKKVLSFLSGGGIVGGILVGIDLFIRWKSLQ